MTGASSLSWFQIGRSLAPETGLALLLLGAFYADLGSKKKNRVEVVDGILLGGMLILLSLFLPNPAPIQLFGGSFQSDFLAAVWKSVILGAGLSAIAMARETREAYGERFTAFTLLMLAAVLGGFFLVSAGDLVTLFISLEWLTISLYIVTAYFTSDRYALEAGTKYLMMGVFSSAILLYGISLIYGATASVHFDQIRLFASWSTASPLFYFGFFLLLAGIGFKISMFPFQLWVPDVYEGAPTPVAAFLSVGSKAAGFGALFKILPLVSGVELDLSWLLGLLAAVTLLYGNLGALGQTNMKRLFAYSSVGHAGYLLIAVACGTRTGFEAALFYLAAYGLTNLTAFFVITLVNHKLGKGEITDYRRLARRSPFLAAVFFLALLSLGGIPPLAGFFGKFLVLKALVDRGFFGLALLGAVSVPISLYYYLAVVREIYFKGETNEGVIETSGRIKIILTALIILLIAIGTFPAPLFNLIQSAVVG